MADKIKSNRVGDLGKPRPVFVHGKLLAVECEYWKWADKETDPVTKKKIKVEGTGGVVEYAEWVKLPDTKRGQKWFISIDQRMFHPDWENATKRSVMVEVAPEWGKYTYPSIADMVGTPEKALDIFLDRAYDENWFVEAELVFTGYYNDKPQNTFKFLRMTQDEAVIREWYKEKYPKGEITVPEDAVARLKLVWKMAKANPDKFNTIVNEDEELSPYLVAASADDYAMVKS